MDGEEAAMSSVRLLVAAAILSSAWLLAQDHAPNPSQLPAKSNLDSISETGRLSIDQLGSISPTVFKSPLLGFQTPEPTRFGQDQVQIQVLEVPQVDNFAIPPYSFVDHYCLKIRSYLMAPDGKNSDSTHLAGYSTCLPASRYRLRTAVGSSQPESSR
jgi:hypothetical protein